MDREYYPINKAAELAKKDIQEIVHFGATGKLPIYVFARGYPQCAVVTNIDPSIETKYYRAGDKILDPSKFSLSGLYRLTSECIQELEFKKNPLAILDLTFDLGPIEGAHKICASPSEQIFLTIDKLYILGTDIKLIATVNTSESRPSGGVYRSSLLKFALGMAISKYNYDPNGGRNTMIGRMKADLDKTYYSLDEETINKILQEAQQLTIKLKEDSTKTDS